MVYIEVSKQKVYLCISKPIAKISQHWILEVPSIGVVCAAFISREFPEAAVKAKTMGPTAAMFLGLFRYFNMLVVDYGSQSKLVALDNFPYYADQSSM